MLMDESWLRAQKDSGKDFKKSKLIDAHVSRSPTYGVGNLLKHIQLRSVHSRTCS